MKRPEQKPKPILKKDLNFSTTKLFTQSCASFSSFAPGVMHPFKCGVSLGKFFLKHQKN